MIVIDGSHGQGGGQVLRTSLAMASILGEEVVISNIRVGRSRPGLAMQHLAGIKALEAMAGARADGAQKGSTRVEFVPGEVMSGEYTIDIGTAGSISLLLQTLFLPCASAGDDVVLRIRGGTDVNWSPPMDYVRKVFLPMVGKMGFMAEADIRKRGYYPKGGGEVVVKVEPCSDLHGVSLLEKGKLLGVQGKAHSSNLPDHVLDRMVASARESLEYLEPAMEKERANVLSTGTGITLWAEYDNTVLGASAQGKIGKPAEGVGKEGADTLASEMASSTVDSHMADQIVPFMALADGTSEMMVSKVTGHLATNIYTVERFLDVKFEMERIAEGTLVRVDGVGWRPG